MRNFGKIKLSNRDYERVVRRYIRFYKNENECSNRCPVIDTRPDWLCELIGSLWGRQNQYSGRCFCCQLPMFPDKGCPCVKMGQDAFKALEKMVKKYGKESM